MNNALVNTFMNLVRIDSESGNEDKFANFLKKSLAKFASKIEEDKSGNLYIFCRNYSSRGAIMLNTHMDTVSPGVGIKPKISKGNIISNGDTILGADSKAGIAAFVEILVNKSNDQRPFVVTLTRCEESGIPSAKNIKPITKYAVVPDRGTPIGEMILQAPYAQVFEIVTKGKFAYAPTSYNKGKSALLALTDLVRAMRLGDIDEQSTVNIGTLSSGNTASMIPDYGIARGSIYTFNFKTLKNYISELRNIIFTHDKLHGTSTSIKLLEYYPGFDNSKGGKFVEIVRTAINKTGNNAFVASHKAVTNANFLQNAGIETVLLSTGVKNQHTTQESISIRDLQYTYDVLSNLIAG